MCRVSASTTSTRTSGAGRDSAPSIPTTTRVSTPLAANCTPVSRAPVKSSAIINREIMVSLLSPKFSFRLYLYFSEFFQRRQLRKPPHLFNFETS